MKVNYSAERRAQAIAWARGSGLLAEPLSEEARLMAMVGVLICDEAGRMKEADLMEAMRDPSALQVAVAMLTEARS